MGVSEPSSQKVDGVTEVFGAYTILLASGDRPRSLGACTLCDPPYTPCVSALTHVCQRPHTHVFGGMHRCMENVNGGKGSYERAQGTCEVAHGM